MTLPKWQNSKGRWKIMKSGVGPVVDTGEELQSNRKWTVEEDRILIDATERGESNSEIASKIPGRNADAVRHRRGYLKSRGKWIVCKEDYNSIRFSSVKVKAAPFHRGSPEPMGGTGMSSLV